MIDFEEWLQKTLIKRNLLPQEKINEVLNQQKEYLLQTGKPITFSAIINKRFGTHVHFSSLKNDYMALIKSAQLDTITIPQQQLTIAEISGSSVKTVDVSTTEMQARIDKCSHSVESKINNPTTTVDYSPTEIQAQIKNSTASENVQENVAIKTIDVSEQVMEGYIQEHENKKSFGRYQIVKKLGEGNVGEVFLAYDPQLNRNIALKILLSKKNKDDINISRFYREAQAISQMRHPNIASAYDIGEEQGVNYFTMDYIEGKSLFQVLEEQKKIPLKQAAKIIKKMGEALFYAHKRNIVHRDIKPANIMIDNDGEPYLMDFGLAREIEGGKRLSKSGTIAGTPSYMSPEQARGLAKEIDSRSDIYSLGATLYRLITGELVFQGNSLLETLFKVTQEAPISPNEHNPKIPKSLNDICLKALEKDKKKRYQTGQEMANDLRHYLTKHKAKPSYGGRKKAVSSENEISKSQEKPWLLIAFVTSLIICFLLTINNFQLRVENKRLNKKIDKLQNLHKNK